MEVLSSLAERGGPLLYTSVAVVALTWFLSTVFKSSTNAPWIGLEYGDAENRRAQFAKDASGLVRDGYTKFKNAAFKLSTQSADVVVVSGAALEEMKTETDKEHSSSAKALEILFSAKYTGFPSSGDDLKTVNLIRTNLTPGLARFVPVLFDTVDEALVADFPSCKEWTPVNVNQKLLRVIAKVSNRIFVGPELCLNEDWIAISIDFTLKVFAGANALGKWRPWLRPFMRYFIKEIDDTNNLKQRAEDFMVPIIKARRAAMEKGEFDENKPDDFLQWCLDQEGKTMNRKVERQAEIQLALSLGGIHTSSMMLTHSMYDLAARPELVALLREELQGLLDANNGKWNKTMLNDAWKLDSFMREVMRLNPSSFLGVQRLALHPFNLSDGTHIPAGTILQANLHGVYRDAAIYPDPDAFDPLRSYKQRKAASANEQAKYLFTTSNKESLGWGYGKHACPGRWFAENEIKLILATLVLKYDMKLVDEQAGRPANWQFGAQIMPDPTKEILLKEV
ncbi:cytochrome P450 [Lophium mytilinum]|uniref:Cytochrome P450 n=1 Tax=Lophium mytilinum TaxID=390894 RepID=A0A6A6QR28_9PEZI|nr:cytochrome P450 [Lophium mytilinum]